jgi:CRISPR/Cas system-associated endonuclease Cas3-HD
MNTFSKLRKQILEMPPLNGHRRVGDGGLYYNYINQITLVTCINESVNRDNCIKWKFKNINCPTGL